jgi:hypothetical protein
LAALTCFRDWQFGNFQHPLSLFSALYQSNREQNSPT